MLRSIVAIVVGFLVIGALAFGTDYAVRSAVPGVYDSAGRMNNALWLLFTLAYVFVFATAGCYLAAYIAGRQPVRHALILGALGLIFNIAGTAAMWNTAPAWYHVAALLLVMPAAWLGGRIRERQLGSSRGSSALA